MKKILRIIGNLAGLLILGALTVIVALNLRERQPHVMPASAVFQSPIKEPALTPRPSEPGTPTPGPADAAICALYPTPPYPINLTPCPYYLTPPADPVLVFTPAPRSTPVAPSIIVGPQTGTANGSTFRPVYISRDYLGPGELCELRPSPDQEELALHLCSTEGLSLIIIVRVKDGKTVGEPREGWFRGWFPDSKQWLLMGDHLEILNLETGESRRITPEGETVTDAAVSPDGKIIAYTIIQGDRIKLIDAAGNLLREILAPLPKPGDRPEGITWSADGRFIAYVWDQTVIQFNSFGPLWVAETQTGKQQQLSPGKVFDGFPTWSPQSHQIVVVQRANMEDRSADFDLNKLNSNLWVVDTDTQEWLQLTDLKGQGAWSPVWTPDGSGVAFISNIDNQLNGWWVNVDNRSLRQLTFDGRIMPRALGMIP